MLTDLEFDAYVKGLGLSEEAVAVIQHIRSSEPARLVHSGPGNVSCRYPSEKMGRTLQAESHTVELPAIQTWEHSEDVLEIWDQTPRIALSREKNGRRPGWNMRPDFFLLHKDWAGWVECKHEDDLARRAEKDIAGYARGEDGSWRHLPGEEYAERLGLRFVVRSSKDTEWNLLQNVLFLADYRDSDCPAAAREAVSAALKKLHGQPWWILRDFIEAEPRVDADVAFKLISEGEILFDMRGELLSEPEVAHVFRDQASLDANREYLASLTNGGPTPPEAVVIEVGRAVLWDGNNWTIANESPGHITLRADSGTFERLTRDAFGGFVRQGAICSTDGVVDQRAAEREALLRHASPTDLIVATERLWNIFPDLGTPAKKYAKRTLSALRALYREAESTLGSGYVGLLPKIHARGNRERKIDAAVDTAMDEVIAAELSDARRGLITPAYGSLRSLCTQRGLQIPSEKAFRLRIKVKKREVDRVREQQGEKAAYGVSDFVWQLDRTTPRHGDRPYAIGHIDHTKLDLQVRGRRFGEKKSRLWLSILIDAFTRKVLAFYLSFDPPSYRSCMCLIRDCVRRGHRVPSILVVDKGKEFHSRYFEQLLARLHVTKKTRPTAKGRYGSIVERFFGLTNQQFVHHLWGNTKASRDPRRMSKSHDPAQLAEWDIETFQDGFDGYIETGYGTLEHPALGMPPNDAMKRGLALLGSRAHKVEPYTREFIFYTMPTTAKGKAIVQPGRGVKINYLYYMCEEFKDPVVERTSVHVRYNPFDLSLAAAYVNGKWVNLRSEHASLFARRSEREIFLISAELRERDRKTGLRRGVNAERIAAYLKEAEAMSETVKEQRRRDEEMNQVGTDVRMGPKPDEADERQPPNPVGPESDAGDISAAGLPPPGELPKWYVDDMSEQELEELGELA